MTLVQARLQIAIRTAYEEMFFGSKTVGLSIIIEQFSEATTEYSLKHETLARLVKYFNFHRFHNVKQEPSMLLAGVLYLQDNDLVCALVAASDEFKEAALQLSVNAAVDLGLSVRKLSVETILYNYALSEMLEKGNEQTSLFTASRVTVDSITPSDSTLH